MFDDRIIGQLSGHPGGPLVIAIGATHGNEPAGVYALAEVFKLLEAEPLFNPEFQFKGHFVGLIGNLAAFHQDQRFLHKDLNRIWSPNAVAQLFLTPEDNLVQEEKELIELLAAIRDQISRYDAKQLVLLDLHTTSADGGIFTIPLEDNAASIALAQSLYAPVVLGLLKGLDGTLMHYASGNHFKVNGLPESVCSIAFEAGRHGDPISVSRSISAIISTLKVAGCVSPDAVDHEHDDFLKAYSANLPKLVNIVYVHHIGPDDHFQMNPGYSNFQRVTEGEILALDRNGPVCAPLSGLILMPLYQPKGTDGFFIVEEIQSP